MKLDFSAIISLIKNFLPMGAEFAHKAVEGWLTIPKVQRDKLYKGMSADDVAEAEQLRKRFTDAGSDYAVFVASRGAIEADEEEYAS